MVLDLRELSSATDFFVIASGRSDVQVKAIADHVLDSAKAAGVRPDHVEGKDDGRWILLDYIDYVVHVFHAPVREFYRLEALWGDATALPMDEPPPSADADHSEAPAPGPGPPGGQAAP